MVVIDDGLGRRIVVQRVHREVAPCRILGLAAEDIVAQDTALVVGLRLVAALFAVMTAESGHFDGFHAHVDVHDLEATTDDARAPKTMPDLFRRRIGGDVEVFRHQTSQQVAHGTADDVGLIAALLQGLDGAPTATTDLLPLQTVLGSADDRRLTGAAGAFSSKDAGYELADHRWWLVARRAL